MIRPKLKQLVKTNHVTVKMEFRFVRFAILLHFIHCCLPLEVGWFWHVTDFHWDTSYNDTGLSCNKQTQRGEFGDVWCDSPWLLVESSVHAMKSFKADVDFILWTGDSVAHISNMDTSIQKNEMIVGNITDLLYSAFPTVPLYPTYGNHDYYPSNMYPPNGNQLYNETYEMWRQWLSDPDQENTFKKGGYYTLKTRHGLRIVALNTNLYYKSDKVTVGLNDPADQFLWLDGVLTLARTDNEKVMITAHIPPVISEENSKPYMQTHYHNTLNDIILNFTDVIIGMHFGHQHIDDLRMYYKSDTPAVVVFSAPSVTPWRYKIFNVTGPARNPAIRLVKYDRQTGRHLDLIQYYLDLQASNNNSKAVWKQEYGMVHDYQLKDIAPNSIHNLFQKFKNSNSKEFRLFYKWKTVNIDRSCDPACHLNVWCGLRHFKQDDFDLCLTQSKVSPELIG